MSTPKTAIWAKPPIGGGVNWGHPLARGLISAVPFVEGAGHPRDWVQNKVLGNPTYTFPASGWSTTRMGPGIKFSGNTSESIELGLAGAVNSADDLTLVAWTTFGGTSATDSYVLAMGAGTSQFTGLMFNTFNAKTEGVWLPSGANDTPLGIAFPSDTTRPYMIGYVHKAVGVAGTVWNDGIKTSSGGTANQTGTQDTTSKWYIGGKYSAAATAHNGIVLQTLIYRRALNADEMARLAADPYGWAMSPPRPSALSRLPTTFNNYQQVNAGDGNAGIISVAEKIR